MTGKRGAKMRYDKGYTLIELIVVIAIIAILSTMVMLSISVVFSTGAKQSAAEADALISQCKVGCMSHSDGTYLALYLDANGKLMGEYFENGASVSADTLGSRPVSVSYRIPGAGEVELNDSETLYIAFSRATGGLQTFGASPTGPYAGGNDPAEITVSAGAKVYVITVDALTGSHILED